MTAIQKIVETPERVLVGRAKKGASVCVRPYGPGQGKDGADAERSLTIKILEASGYECVGELAATAPNGSPVLMRDSAGALHVADADNPAKAGWQEQWPIVPLNSPKAQPRTTTTPPGSAGGD